MRRAALCTVVHQNAENKYANFCVRARPHTPHRAASAGITQKGKYFGKREKREIRFESSHFHSMKYNSQQKYFFTSDICVRLKNAFLLYIGTNILLKRSTQLSPRGCFLLHALTSFLCIPSDCREGRGSQHSSGTKASMYASM